MFSAIKWNIISFFSFKSLLMVLKGSFGIKKRIALRYKPVFIHKNAIIRRRKSVYSPPNKLCFKVSLERKYRIQKMLNKTKHPQILIKKIEQKND